MCVLALWVGLDPKVPLIVAANRDESYGRPSAAPREIEPGIIAGQDLQAGGTWLGRNAEGLVVAITNRRSPARTDASLSRGRLALEALRCRKLACVEGLVERRVRDHPIAGFSLIAVAGTEGRSLHFDGKLRRAQFGAGVHAISSDRDLDDPEMPEKRRLDRLVAERPGLPDLASLREFLSSHEGDRPVCKHGEGFGTVSSTLLLCREGAVEQYFAPGPPCRTPYVRIA